MIKRVLRFAGIGCCLLALTGGLASSWAQAPDGRAHHAAVIVQYASGEVAARCVGFDEESITGYQVLERAGFNIVAEGSAGIGAMVCSIDGVGCDYPNESCACRCEGGVCSYWAYTHQAEGFWKYSALGASSYRVRDGMVEGWAWGGGSVERGAEPPLIGWADICAAQAQPVPTPEPPPTAPPTEAPTAVPPTAIPATSTRPPVPAPPTNQPDATSAPTRPSPAATAAPVASHPPAPTPAADAHGSAASATTVLPTATTAARPSAPTASPAAALPSPQPAGIAATLTDGAATPTLAPETAGPAGSMAGTNAATPSVAPAAASSGSASQAPTPWINYLAFGAIAGLLGLAAVIVRRRRPQAGPRR